ARSPGVLHGPAHPLPADADPRRRRVAGGHVAAVRPEVIDLSQRRLADEASPKVSSDARPAAGAERRTEPATAAAPVTTPAGSAESPSSSSASLSPGSGGEAAAASQAPARSSAAETGGETTVAKAESPASASTPAPAQTSA